MFVHKLFRLFMFLFLPLFFIVGTITPAERELETHTPNTTSQKEKKANKEQKKKKENPLGIFI